jgi:hypothetical protein
MLLPIKKLLIFFSFYSVSGRKSPSRKHSRKYNTNFQTGTGKMHKMCKTSKMNKTSKMCKTSKMNKTSKMCKTTKMSKTSKMNKTSKMS